jgi:hypothetical protein
MQYEPHEESCHLFTETKTNNESNGVRIINPIVDINDLYHCESCQGVNNRQHWSRYVLVLEGDIFPN